MDNVLCSEITHADDSRVRKAFSGVCDSVCLFVRTIKPKPNLSNLPQGLSLVRHDTLPTELILGQKVKGQGHTPEKMQKGDRVAGVKLNTLLSVCSYCYHLSS